MAVLLVEAKKLLLYGLLYSFPDIKRMVNVRGDMLGGVNLAPHTGLCNWKV